MWSIVSGTTAQSPRMRQETAEPTASARTATPSGAPSPRRRPSPPPPPTSRQTYWDYITIGDMGSNGPSNVQMAAGAQMTWFADGSVTNGGWIICGTSTTPPPPRPPPPPPALPSCTAAAAHRVSAAVVTVLVATRAAGTTTASTAVSVTTPPRPAPPPLPPQTLSLLREPPNDMISVVVSHRSRQRLAMRPLASIANQNERRCIWLADATTGLAAT